MLITSSVYATIPFKSFTLQDVADETVYTADNRIAYDEGPYADEAQAYAASKVKALIDSES